MNGRIFRITIFKDNYFTTVICSFLLDIAHDLDLLPPLASILIFEVACLFALRKEELISLSRKFFKLSQVYVTVHRCMGKKWKKLILPLGCTIASKVKTKVSSNFSSLCRLL